MTTQQHTFNAEVAQLLHLVTHSLYSNPDIFARELISNASDACDKLRFEALNQPELYEGQPELAVRIAFDEKARTITITDTGIGMSAQEAISHLGTIAKSGTKDFVGKLTGDQKADSQLIGQFGVGFYSGFVVADKITVESRRAGLPADQGVRWVSGGTGDFTTETITREARGTSITLHLREDKLEYLNGYKLKSIISAYSDHIGLPIYMPEEKWQEGENGQPGGMVATGEWEQVNEARALWTLPKKDITDEQYQQFYQALAHDYSNPLAWSHNKVEGNTEYTQLLYIPAHAPFDLYQRDAKHGLKLYVKRVFIMDDAEALLPQYLRFVKGVVDASDLPLNVSRELLQESRDVKTIRDGNTRRVLSMVEDLAKGENYAEFYNVFGAVLKEGLGEDQKHQQRIAKLLRYHSTQGEAVSLDDYKARMKEGQEAIYYITADNLAAAKNSPQLELFAKKGIEVLLMTDRVDEWAMGFVPEYEGTPLRSVAKGAVDLGALQDEAEKQAAEQAAEQAKPLLEKLKEVLKEQAQDVRVTSRLVDSPACLVSEDNGMSVQLARMLRQAGQPVPDIKPVLEINVDHALIQKLAATEDSTRFADLAHIVFDQALLAEGGMPADPASYVKRINALLV